MDYRAAIERIYEYVAQDDVGNAVRTCLRLARNLKDYLPAAIFLRELYTDPEELKRAFYDDVHHLKEEAQEFIWNRSQELWLATHLVPYVGSDEGDLADNEKSNLLAMGAGELRPHIAHCENSIRDLEIPPGMTPYDTAYFTEKSFNFKWRWRRKCQAVQCVMERLKSRCFNYAGEIERQLNAQQSSETFLHEVQCTVNNYFKAHCKDVHSKLWWLSASYRSRSMQCTSPNPT